MKNAFEYEAELAALRDEIERLKGGQGAPRLRMSHVVEAHMEIPNCPILTSNQCHNLAVKLNACLDKELNQ